MSGGQPGVVVDRPQSEQKAAAAPAPQAVRHPLGDEDRGGRGDQSQPEKRRNM